jgi:hypothetical protein
MFNDSCLIRLLSSSIGSMMTFHKLVSHHHKRYTTKLYWGTFFHLAIIIEPNEVLCICKNINTLNTIKIMSIRKSHPTAARFTTHYHI